jgi:hypothetical protein
MPTSSTLFMTELPTGESTPKDQPSVAWLSPSSSGWAPRNVNDAQWTDPDKPPEEPEAGVLAFPCGIYN